jgi:hypothetical protein
MYYFCKSTGCPKKRLHVIGDFNSEFIYAAVSGFSNGAVLTGRPFGGCTILLRKSLAITFKQLECESPRATRYSSGI